MITKIVELSELSRQLPKRIIEQRLCDKELWIEKHSSGTLLTNKELGFAWQTQYLAERIAYTFGYQFAMYNASNVAFNISYTECDEIAYTKSGRLVKRYILKNLFDEDKFELKYATIYDNNKNIMWEGLVLIVTQTSAKFIPSNKLIMTKIVEFDVATQSFKQLVNFA